MIYRQSQREKKSQLNWIKKIRIERGLSVTKLAELMGIDRSTIHRWESGKYFPSHLHLLALNNIGIIPDKKNN
ncbi:MAG: helix-turn-helix transcriptional regulator [Waterburya sp.]